MAEQTATIENQKQETQQQEQKSQQQGKCPVSAVFSTEDKVTNVVQELINSDKDISREDISVIGKDFQSETRISGFLTRKDVILDGLKNGAIFGSLFGSLLSLLTGVGVLFVPFVGSVVAAGPLGAALLGAASGAVAGGAGAGLVSALVSLGMSEEKAAIYETRVKAGEFLLVVEVPDEETEEIQQMLAKAGGDEIVTCPNMVIPRQTAGPIESPEELSPELRSHLSEDAQSTFIEAYNANIEDSESESEVMTKAWQAVEERFEKDEQGFWSAPVAA